MEATTTTNFQSFMDKLFWIIFLGLAGIAVWNFQQGREDFKSTTQSLTQEIKSLNEKFERMNDNLYALNVKMAVVVQKVELHDEEIKFLRENRRK